MAFDRVSAGKDVPNDINVIIEIPAQADPIKFEVDKDSGAVFVDRFMGTSMRCLLYTSPSPRDKRQSRMPSSA